MRSQPDSWRIEPRITAAENGISVIYSKSSVVNYRYLDNELAVESIVIDVRSRESSN